MYKFTHPDAASKEIWEWGSKPAYQRFSRRASCLVPPFSFQTALLISKFPSSLLLRFVRGLLSSDFGRRTASATS